ncbi:M28 family metallopeptidase [Oceanicaulis sp. LC35]|uniref:M28 family metallopeptidase n=1 Tax=Oceanicaulis sp. LC35 TaxID=3349635 RepID=UPI003F83C2ED
MLRYFITSGVAALALTACSEPPAAQPSEDTAAAPESTESSSAYPAHQSSDVAITEADFAYRISALADDRFEGRGPASEHGEQAATWIAEEMEAIGLEPAGEERGWYQPVPLIESTLDESASSFDITIDGEPMGLQTNVDVVYWSQNPEEQVSLEDSELVFVGYGVVAPEYGWNDYEGVDVTGKTVVILINDPGFADPDSGLFNGSAMTYYGRWTYKYEEAARQGAEGAIIVHQTAPAAYPWGTVQSSWSGPQFTLASSAGQERADVQAWITEDKATELFSALDLDFAELSAAAISPDFEPVDMGRASMSASLTNSLRTLTSNNVAGMVEGSERPDEYVLFMAHWDHIGIRLNFAGDDQIYNGAIDNATGVAALLELAEAYAKAETAPERSVIFVAVTAEEQGLLGSEYYAQNPLIPLDQTVGGFNFDGILPIGRTEDIVVIGYGASELEDLLQAEVEADSMYISPDPNPEAGYFYRSDHVTLARRGVPMLYADSGSVSAEHGRDYAAQIETAYRLQAYHKPADEFDPNWDMGGFVQSTELMYRVSRQLTDSEDWPNWYEDNEFRAIRDAMMQD